MESANFVFNNGTSITLKMGSADFIFGNLEAEIDDLEGISFAFEMVQIPSRKGMQIFVQPLLSSWKIKANVQDKEVFPLIKQSHEFDSRLQLEGSRTWPDCNTQESTLYLALPSRGGH